MPPKDLWQRGIKKQVVKNAVVGAVADAYRRLRRTPDELLEELLENNTTHFNPDELRKLLLAYKRMTADRLLASRGALLCLLLSSPGNADQRRLLHGSH